MVGLEGVGESGIKSHGFEELSKIKHFGTVGFRHTALRLSSALTPYDCSLAALLSSNGRSEDALWSSVVAAALIRCNSLKQKEFTTFVI